MNGLNHNAVSRASYAVMLHAFSTDGSPLCFPYLLRGYSHIDKRSADGLNRIVVEPDRQTAYGTNISLASFFSHIHDPAESRRMLML